MKRFLVLMLVLALPLFLASCAEDEEEGNGIDPEASDDKVDLAVFSFYSNVQSDDADFTQAYNLFEEAVRLNPSNLEAHAGAGAMNILRLPNHPAIEALMDSLGLEGILGMTVPWSLLDSAGGRTPASGLSRTVFGGLSGQTEVQTDFHTLLDLLLAEIQVSINHFNQVELDPDFQWLLANLTGTGPDTIEIDVTDIHFAESPLHWLKALLLGLEAYKMDVASLDPADVVTALSPGSDFMTLTDPGTLTDAQASMTEGASEMHIAAELLDGETDDQTNDVIRLLFEGEEPGDWPALTEGQLDTLDAMPTMLSDLMTTPTPMIEDFDSDEGTPDDTVMVNLGVLFTDPIWDWKAILPDYYVDVCEDTTLAIFWDATTIDQWVWYPDSLHGLLELPGGEMTSDDMIEIFGLEMMFDMGGCK